jgi:hypothetical protein
MCRQAPKIAGRTNNRTLNTPYPQSDHTAQGEAIMMSDEKFNAILKKAEEMIQNDPARYLR